MKHDGSFIVYEPASVFTSEERSIVAEIVHEVSKRFDCNVADFIYEAPFIVNFDGSKSSLNSKINMQSSTLSAFIAVNFSLMPLSFVSI